MAQMMQNGSPGSAGANSRKDVRFIGDVMGSYVLAARAHTPGAVQVFACRSRSVSSHEAVVNAPVSGAPGDMLTMTLQGLGIMRGRITRILEGGFVVAFDVIVIITLACKLERPVAPYRKSLGTPAWICLP